MKRPYLADAGAGLQLAGAGGNDVGLVVQREGPPVFHQGRAKLDGLPDAPVQQLLGKGLGVFPGAVIVQGKIAVLVDDQHVQLLGGLRPAQDAVADDDAVFMAAAEIAVDRQHRLMVFSDGLEDGGFLHPALALLVGLGLKDAVVVEHRAQYLRGADLNVADEIDQLGALVHLDDVDLQVVLVVIGGVERLIAKAEGILPPGQAGNGRQAQKRGRQQGGDFTVHSGSSFPK